MNLDVTILVLNDCKDYLTSILGLYWLCGKVQSLVETHVDFHYILYPTRASHLSPTALILWKDVRWHDVCWKLSVYHPGDIIKICTLPSVISYVKVLELFDIFLIREEPKCAMFLSIFNLVKRPLSTDQTLFLCLCR